MGEEQALYAADIASTARADEGPPIEFTAPNQVGVRSVLDLVIGIFALCVSALVIMMHFLAGAPLRYVLVISGALYGLFSLFKFVMARRRPNRIRIFDDRIVCFSSSGRRSHPWSKISKVSEHGKGKRKCAALHDAKGGPFELIPGNFQNYDQLIQTINEHIGGESEGR